MMKGWETTPDSRKKKLNNMSCVLTSGYTIGCRDNIGGIQEVYIGTWNGADLTYGITASGAISSFGGTWSTFFTFEQEVETGSFTENGVYSTENGTAFYEGTLEITLQKFDAAVRNKVLILGQGKWRILILDQRGTYWLMGFQNPIRVSAATPGLGKAFGDLNGAVITFLSKEPEPVHEVLPGAAAVLLA
jgi:hypothetical protein